MKSKQLLDLYSDYLLASFGATTATGLSQLVDNLVSHDQVTRFLASETPTAKDLWHVVKPLVRKVQSKTAVLIIDDTIEEKPYTDENEIVCWYFDHSKDRSIKGINFVSALYEANDVSLPVGFQVVSKTERYIDQIHRKRNAALLSPKMKFADNSSNKQSKTSCRLSLSCLILGLPPLRT